MAARILIFGGDGEFLRTIEPLLRTASCEVAFATTIEELVDTVERDVVDVIVGNFSAGAVDRLNTCCEIRHSLGIPCETIQPARAARAHSCRVAACPAGANRR